ncbi:pentatricopeptide repeat (PPR) superfamily protein [Actinidia rufa]|uniref:Pentatricopeptide repeat (PPR) superfamily protein n=1 Tax=Actinidia rufa TaxID=165716 RepID=A0A7J0EQC9_9ERIC|nr:pentatricopeptide repeat (PPR) superfamily protein [Actinidia rufa]
MIAGYAENYRLVEALKLFDKMPVRDTVCWNSMIKGCLDCGDLNMGMKLFDEMPERNVVSWTTMVNGYLQFGRIEVAEGLFCAMPARDIAAWNSMIYGYFCNGRVDDGMRLFEEMPRRNVISWTSVISGLDLHGRSDEALFLFRQMVVSSVEPTSSTFSSVITACANVMDLQLGVQVHALIVMLGLSFDAFVTASLVTFYANCKQIDNCCKIFNENLHVNVVVWTALLTGYGLNCKHEDALKVFGDMIKLGILPNQSSFTSALNSCCELEALDRGKVIHATAIKLGLETDAFVANSLIELYSKCGNLKNGVTIFKNIGKKNIVSWNSIIVGCAQHGCGVWALTFFTQMIRVGVGSDEITLTGLLSACSHSGMLQKGRRIFEYFSQCKAIELKLEHYACMVDILGRSGKLKEAEELVKNMPMEPNIMVWLALLSACRIHLDLELAEETANRIFSIQPHCSAAYVLLSNLYADSGRWSDVARIRTKMRGRGIEKQPGWSWVTLKGQRHEFLSEDRSHPSRKYTKRPPHSRQEFESKSEISHTQNNVVADIPLADIALTLEGKRVHVTNRKNLEVRATTMAVPLLATKVVKNRVKKFKRPQSDCKVSVKGKVN